MVARRIIPTFLYRGTTLVKGVGFNSWRSVGNVVQAAKIYAARDVDELCIFDIGATPKGHGPNFELVEKIVDQNFTPLMVGGGISTVEQVQRLLNSGADKVAICSALKSNPELIDKIAKRYGSQVLCAVIEVRGEMKLGEIRRLATEYGDRGAGEIMLQEVESDGTMAGYPLQIIEFVSNIVRVPLIISGGCSGYEDMHAAILYGADAVAAGAIFQFTDCTPRAAAEYLHEKGVDVRI